MTTWVEGLEDTTVGDAGGRPIGFGIDKELKFPKEVWKPSPEKTTDFETRNVKIYYYCPDGTGTLESRTTTPTLVETGYTALRGPLRRHSATTSCHARGLRAAAVPGLGVQRDGHHHRCAPPSTRRRNPRARSPPLTRPPPSPADELSCTCDKGTTFCTRVESGHVTMLSPVEVAVVVICVLIVVLVAICMCAFAAKKKMIVKEVKHGPGNAL